MKKYAAFILVFLFSSVAFADVQGLVKDANNLRILGLKVSYAAQIAESGDVALLCSKLGEISDFTLMQLPSTNDLHEGRYSQVSEKMFPLADSIYLTSFCGAWFNADGRSSVILYSGHDEVVKRGDIRDLRARLKETLENIKSAAAVLPAPTI